MVEVKKKRQEVFMHEKDDANLQFLEAYDTHVPCLKLCNLKYTVLDMILFSLQL